MNLLAIDPGLMVWTWICFLILFAILGKFALPNFFKGLAEREASIARSLENAAKVEERLAAMDGEHAAILQKAKNEADDIVRQARIDGERLRQHLLSKAEDEARLTGEHALQKAQEERTALLEALQDDIARLVCDGSERLIGHSFLEADDREWTKDLVKTL